MDEALIFCDIDGVLVTRDTRPVGWLDCALVARLERLCKETGAVVVISSNWRMFGLPDLRARFLRAGFTGRIVGLTPPLGGFAHRGAEIAAYLGTHYPAAWPRFVILDDDTDMGTLAPYLVRTRTARGLQDAEVADAALVLSGVVAGVNAR